MLGGIAEIYAYGSGVNTTPSVSCCGSEEDISKVCDASSAVFGGFKGSHTLPNDFVLIAECDENSGPEPLVVIPKGGGKGIDLNSLTLKLLSSDYQGYGSTSSVPIQDTQALFPDVIPSVHAVVNYFALADIHSRGYVRPVCVAYLSSDKFKLIQNFLPIKKALCEACRTIKFHNKSLFIHEINNTIQDLTFTKEVMQNGANSPATSSLTVSRLQEELVDVTMADLQSLHEKIQTLIDKDYQEQIEDAQAFLGYLGQVEEYKDYHSLTYHKWHFQRNPSVYKPQVLKLPLRSNFNDQLRSTPDICDVGFLMGLYYLYITHRIFSRKYENIFLTSEEQNKAGECLKFGACLKASVYFSSEMTKCNRTECQKLLKHVPVSVKSLSKNCCKFMDSGYFSIISHFYSRKCEENSQRNNFNENMTSSLLNTPSECRPQCDINVDNLKSSSSFWHGYSVVGLLDVIDQMEELFTDAPAVLDMLKQFGHLSDLFYSLLMGQCTIILGTLEGAKLVQALVRVLSLLCPRDPKGAALFAQPWRETVAGLKDLTGLALVGMPLPSENSVGCLVPKAVLMQVSVWNTKTGSFSGLPYKGVLLGDLNRRIKSVPPKGPLLATLVSFLADLELKVQVWKAMCQKSNQGSAMPNKYFTEKGFSRNDLDILETLSTMVF